MNKKINGKFIFPVMIFLFMANPLRAADGLVLSDGNKYTPGLKLEILEDSEKKFTIKDVSSPEFLGRFHICSDEVPNFGYISSAIWFRLKLTDLSPDKKWVMELNYAMIDDFRLYIPAPGGGFLEKKTGRNFPFSAKEIKSRNSVFRLDIEKMKEQTCYLRVESADSLPFPLIIWEYNTFREQDHKEQFYLGLYYGLILVMFLFNIIVYFNTRDINYLYYVLTIIVLFGFFQMGVNGLSFEYIGQNSIWWSRTSIAFFFSLGIVLALQFCRSFLSIKTSIPLLYKISNILIVWGLVEAVLSFFIDYSIAIQSAVLMGQFCVALVWISTFLSIIKGNRSARFFMLAWSIILVGGSIYSLKVWGILPSNFFTEYTWQIGSAIEAVLLSMALGDLINNMRQEKNRAQLEAFEALKETGRQKDEFLLSITEKNESIEKLNTELENKIEVIDIVNKTLSMSEEKYRFLVEGTSDIIFSMDDNFTILTANKSVKTHLSIRPESLISSNFIDLIYENPDDLDLVTKKYVLEKLDNFSSTGEAIDFRAEFKLPILSESKEMMVSLERVNIEGKKEIFAKVASVQEDILIRYFIGENQQFEIDNYLMTAEELSRRVTRNLIKYMDAKEVNLIRIALREILINAIEHGNLNISFEEKSEAMMSDRYFEFVAERKNDTRFRNRKVEIVYSLDGNKAVYSITDEGEGFDYRAYLKDNLSDTNDSMQQHGRGISMTKSVFDEILFNEKGNQVMLTKYLRSNF